MFRRSLETDSHREANTLMIALIPQLLMVKGGLRSSEELTSSIASLVRSRMVNRAANVLPMSVPQPLMNTPVTAQPPALTLAKAWEQYKAERGMKWTIAIASANDRYIEPLLALLGPDSDVEKITTRDIRHVMESVENLPKRVIQSYRAMTIHQLLACDDVPEKDLIGTEAIHKHLKIYKSLF